VINTSLRPISRRSQVFADYWSHLRFQQGVPSLTHSFGANSQTHEGKIWRQETRNMALSHSAKCVSISWIV